MASFTNVYFGIGRCQRIMQSWSKNMILTIENSYIMLIKTVMTCFPNVIKPLPYFLMKFFSFSKSFFSLGFSFSDIAFPNSGYFLYIYFFDFPFLVLDYGISLSPQIVFSTFDWVSSPISCIYSEIYSNKLNLKVKSHWIVSITLLYYVIF